MVAATFPNLSFENPPGTGPTLVSANVEPFVFADGDILTLTFAGLDEAIVFLSTDFADIGAATADEVAALIESRVDYLGASNDDGAVRLTSLLTGEDVSLEVAATGANVGLAFPAGAVTGETYDGGAPNGWTVTAETDSVTEWAEFADENGRAEEIFDLEGWSAITISDAYVDAVFDALLIPAPFETFSGWSSTGLLTSLVGESAAFGTTGVFETFEDWGSPLYFEFLPVHLIDASANPETFETGWGQAGAPTYEDATFENGTVTVDDFENTTPTTHEMVILANAIGDWIVTVAGEAFKYPATGGDTDSDIALGIANAIDSGSVIATAAALGTQIRIAPRQTGVELAVTASAPSGGGFTLLLASESSAFVTYWTGQDLNPDFE